MAINRLVSAEQAVALIKDGDTIGLRCARPAIFRARNGERKDLSNAIALNSTMIHLAIVAGPAAAGLAYAFIQDT